MYACNYAQVAEYITPFWKIVHIQVKFNIHAHACIYTATVAFDFCMWTLFSTSFRLLKSKDSRWCNTRIMQEFWCIPKKYHIQKYSVQSNQTNLENFQTYKFKLNYISIKLIDRCTWPQTIKTISF